MTCEYVISFEKGMPVGTHRVGDRISISKIDGDELKRPTYEELRLLETLVSKPRYKNKRTEPTGTIYLEIEDNKLNIYKGQSPDNGKAHPRKEIIGKEKDEILRVLKTYFEKGCPIPKDDHYELVL